MAKNNNINVNAVKTCIYDEDMGLFYKDCVIDVINKLVEMPFLTNKNFESATIEAYSVAGVRHYFISDGSTEHELKQLAGAKYQNSISRFVNTRTNDIILTLNEAQLQLLKVMLRSVHLNVKVKYPLTNFIPKKVNFIYTSIPSGPTRRGGKRRRFVAHSASRRAKTRRRRSNH